MLQQLRAVSKSWVSSIFLGALALSFGVWGIADIFRGNVDTSVAAIGGHKMPAETFQRDYRIFLRNAGARAGHPITSDEAHAKGLDREALQVAISRNALDQITARYGLVATDAQVASSIRAISAFRGPLGAFDQSTFLQTLSRAGYTEESFVATEREDISRSQLLGAVHSGLALPSGYVQVLFDYLNERRAADYILVPREAAGAPPAPSDAELAAYVKSQPAAFSTPEYRDITYAVAAPQDVMNKVHVTEEELKQQYELRKEQYQIAEKRDVEQITFPDEASAKAGRAKIESGTSFADLAVQRGLKSQDIALGDVVQDDLGKDRGPAVFALPVGGVTPALKSTFGWVILHVVKVTPGVSKSFADVRDSLRKDVMNQLASAKLTDVTNAFDDASAGGAPLAEAAQRVGMRVVHVPAVDSNGLTPSGAKANLPATADFLAQLGKSEVGEEGDPFPSTDGGVYVIKVNGVTPPRLKPLSSIRAQAQTSWTDAMEKQRLSKLAETLTREASADKSLSAIASRLHASVQSTEALARTSAPPTLPAELVAKLFAATPGAVVSAPAFGNQGIVVARVTGVFHPPAPMDSPEIGRLAQSLSDQAAEDLESTLATAARTRLGVTINQSQADRITGSGS